jgi:hypothetical protein
VGTPFRVKLARSRGEIAELYFNVIASEAKQSSLAFLLPHGLLRFARNDDVGTGEAV